MSSLAPEFLLVLVAAFGAGLVDAMVGGGGLIQLPALLSAYPTTSPPLLLGTNKLASIFGTLSAVARYARTVRIPWRVVMPLVVIVFLGSLGGALTVSRVPPDIFRPLVPVMLAAVLLYLLKRKDFGTNHAPIAMAGRRGLIAAMLLGGVGFYDGFFGPGTGSFFMFAFVRLYGFDFLHSAACARLLNAGTNAAALLYFGVQGEVMWLAGALMALANVSGAVVGTGLALKHGSVMVRRIFIVIVAVLIAKTAWDAWQVWNA